MVEDDDIVTMGPVLPQQEETMDETTAPMATDETTTIDVTTMMPGDANAESALQDLATSMEKEQDALRALQAQLDALDIATEAQAFKPILPGDGSLLWDHGDVANG